MSTAGAEGGRGRRAKVCHSKYAWWWVQFNTMRMRTRGVREYKLVQRRVVRRLVRCRGDAAEPEDCTDREDEHGRVMARLCKDTKGREEYVGNSGWRSRKKKMGNKHGRENKNKRGQSRGIVNTNCPLDIGSLS